MPEQETLSTLAQLTFEPVSLGSYTHTTTASTSLLPLLLGPLAQVHEHRVFTVSVRARRLQEQLQTLLDWPLWELVEMLHQQKPTEVPLGSVLEDAQALCLGQQGLPLHFLAVLHDDVFQMSLIVFPIFVFAFLIKQGRAHCGHKNAMAHGVLGAGRLPKQF